MAFDLMRWLGFKGTGRERLVPRAVPDKHRSGFSKTTGPHGEIIDCDTLTCCHCQFTWEVVQGSGILRGFCRKCMGYTCGRAACMVCVPFEQRLENLETGKETLYVPPLSLAVPELPATLTADSVATPRKIIVPGE